VCELTADFASDPIETMPIIGGPSQGTGFSIPPSKLHGCPRSWPPWLRDPGSPEEWLRWPGQPCPGRWDSGAGPREVALPWPAPAQGFGQGPPATRGWIAEAVSRPGGLLVAKPGCSVLAFPPGEVAPPPPLSRQDVPLRRRRTPL